jgi:hypothetical protein
MATTLHREKSNEQGERLRQNFGPAPGEEDHMKRSVSGSRQLAAAAALVLAAHMPSAADDSPTLLAGLADTTGSNLVSASGTIDEAGAYHLIDTRLDYPVSWRMAQAAPAPGTSESVEGKEDEPHQVSASELSRQLLNPVTSLWSLQFQFNNYRLENGKWNNNLLFQPVLPIGLTKDLNLITRPVIPLYNSVPHETAPGEFDRTTAFGDITLLELLSPTHSGNWILGAGPTFIFPTATSDFTGQGKWQAGPALVIGYLTKKFIVGVFPQQWWSFDRRLEPAGHEPDEPSALCRVVLRRGMEHRLLGQHPGRLEGPVQQPVDRTGRRGDRQGGEAWKASRQDRARRPVHAHPS